ncbi:MAG: lipopolysaccharide heptosyltransferase II [Bryobacteraceae bacterium]
MSAPPRPLPQPNPTSPNWPADPARILIRATNWVGDAVMSLPAIRAVRERFPVAHVALIGFPWVWELYARETFLDEFVPLTGRRGWRDFGVKFELASELRRRRFDMALLLPNSFESAALAYAAGVPDRCGYDRDGRGALLSHPVPRPRPGETPRHESFYYLELLRRLGWIPALPPPGEILFENRDAMAVAGGAKLAVAGFGGEVVGVCPGAAFGTAKRWLPERFAEAARRVMDATGADAAVFGTPAERDVCETVARAIGSRARNLAGSTSLADFIEMAAACLLFLTNDSGSMHVASAAGTPTVAIFGATDATATGPSSARAVVVSRKVECSPCLLRECPIDHRCMLAVEPATVAETALNLLK